MLGNLFFEGIKLSRSSPPRKINGMGSEIDNPFTPTPSRALEGVGVKGLSISLPMPLILRGGEDLDSFMPSKNRLPSNETLKLLEEDYQNDESLSNVLSTIRKRPIAMMELHHSNRTFANST